MLVWTAINCNDMNGSPPQDPQLNHKTNFFSIMQVAHQSWTRSKFRNGYGADVWLFVSNPEQFRTQKIKKAIWSGYRIKYFKKKFLVNGFYLYFLYFSFAFNFGANLSFIVIDLLTCIFSTSLFL